MFPKAFRTNATGRIYARELGDIRFDLLPIALVITHHLAPGTDGK
jgi:hypothetical protein